MIGGEANAAGSGYEHVVLDVAQLKEVSGPWRELWGRCTAPVFQHPAWTLNLLEPSEQPCGHVLFEDGQLVGVAVLVARDGGLRMGGHPLNDANELLAVDASAAAALLRAAARFHAAPLTLDLLTPEGPTARLLRDGWEGEVGWIGAEPCPTLPVGAEPGRRLRTRFERERRRAAVELRCNRPTEVDVAGFFDRRLRQWAERGGTDLLAHLAGRRPGFPRALARACTELARDGLCHIAALIVDESVVAEDLYLGDRRAPLLYMRRFERTDPLSSPGLMLATMVRELPGIGEIDLGRGAEEYKFRLGARADTRLAARIAVDGCG